MALDRRRGGPPQISCLGWHKWGSEVKSTVISRQSHDEWYLSCMEASGEQSKDLQMRVRDYKLQK